MILDECLCKTTSFSKGTCKGKICFILWLEMCVQLEILDRLISRPSFCLRLKIRWQYKNASVVFWCLLIYLDTHNPKTLCRNVLFPSSQLEIGAVNSVTIEHHLPLNGFDMTWQKTQNFFSMVISLLFLCLFLLQFYCFIFLFVFWMF